MTLKSNVAFKRGVEYLGCVLHVDVITQSDIKINLIFLKWNYLLLILQINRAIIHPTKPRSIRPIKAR